MVTEATSHAGFAPLVKGFENKQLEALIFCGRWEMRTLTDLFPPALLRAGHAPSEIWLPWSQAEQVNGHHWNRV